MGDDTKKNNPVKRDLRSWLVAILGIAVLIAIASYVYKTVPGSSAYGDLPATFDWRDHQGKNWMTSVKDQGQCGVCGIFASVGAIEAVANIEANDPNLDLNLSEQYIVSCAGDNICELGIRIVSALGFIKFEGVSDEQCFPYTATNGNCSDRCNDWEDRLTSIQDYDTVPFFNYYDPSAPPADYNPSVKQLLIQEGPLVVTMQYNGHFVNNIYVCAIDLIPSVSAALDDPYHGVVLVGYNDIEEYWIMKNQWGDNWPPPNGGGYFRVGYNSKCRFEGVYRVSGVNYPTPIGRKIRITNDDVWDGFPDIHKTDIVWAKSDQRGAGAASEEDIYYFDASRIINYPIPPEPRAITNDDFWQGVPAVFNKVVYFGDGSEGEKHKNEGRYFAFPTIVFYPLSNPIRYELCEDRMVDDYLCQNHTGQDCVQTCGSVSAWIDYRYTDPSVLPSIYTFDRFSHEKQIGHYESLCSSYSSPIAMDEDCYPIVWSEHSTGRCQVYYYDGKETKRVYPNPLRSQYSPDVYNNLVVWTTNGTNLVIKEIDGPFQKVIGNMGSDITEINIYEKYVAFLSGGGDWQGVDNDVVLYDIERDKKYFITDPWETFQEGIARQHLAFYGDILVWNESSYTEPWDLYMFKLN